MQFGCSQSATHTFLDSLKNVLKSTASDNPIDSVSCKGWDTKREKKHRISRQL